MGCTGSTLRCWRAGGKRQPKAQQKRGGTFQELTALKTEKADATLSPEDGKEEAALREERTESTRLFQGQEEEEKQLQDASQAGTMTVPQGINNQVEKGKNLQLEEQLDALRREHTQTLQELQRAHEQEKVLLAESYHRSQAALQETVQVLNSQLHSFQEKMKRMEEPLTRTEYKSHVQDHGSPGPFWEQELESLHFVIEMKSERIHSLEKKLLNLETVVERNLLLEEKVKTLQQENEDLRARNENRWAMARQALKELLAPLKELEEEIQLQQQACRAREEQLYRVLNRGDETTSDVPFLTE